jgi:hypothetical protein
MRDGVFQARPQADLVRSRQIKRARASGLKPPADGAKRDLLRKVRKHDPFAVKGQSDA